MTPDLLLNLQIIENYLEDDYNITYFSRWNDKQKLVSACVYYGQRELDETFVYVAEYSVFQQHPIHDSGICRIIVNAPEHSVLSSPSSRIEIDHVEHWEEVFEQVQVIFARHRSWSRELFRILEEGGGLYELLLSAQNYFGNPLYIHDENYTVLASSTWVVGMTPVIVDEEKGIRTFSFEKIQQLKSNPEYMETMTTHGTHFWMPSYANHRTIYANIWNRDHYCGRVLINELNNSLKPGVIPMLEYFTQFLVRVFEMDQAKSKNTLTFEHIIDRMISGETIEENLILTRLNLIGWKRTHRYVCFRIEHDQNSSTPISLPRISGTMNLILKKSFSVCREDGIFTVCNLTLSGYAEPDYRKKMQDLCATAHVVIGSSNEFSDFMLLREYSSLTFRALELGRASGKADSAYFRFSDYALDYILFHFTSDFKVSTVCSDAVIRLLRHDTEKQTDYIHTLKCYLENGCQQTAAADALFIHRSTLVYRLNKICQISGIDLDDPEKRLYLQISIRLLERG
ncbi:MAG: helix-turn-helix domain-containing protein [Lachnospiraceae bacterium]|nr:helix-turn-helix domain-containing protein [Lachnospiraceae bacterium]